MKIFTPEAGPGGIPEIAPETLNENLGKARLIDVRTPAEFTGDLGHIPGAELVELGPELMKWLETSDKKQEVVFVCKSGGRSGQATMASRQMGFENTINLRGGMLQWNARGFVTEK